MAAEGYRIRLEGDHGVEGIHLVAARVEDGFNRVTSGTLEFVTKDKALDLEKIVGQPVRIVMETPGDLKRVFPGTCVSMEFLGTPSGNGHFRAEFRSWFWFLTRTQNCKVYQNLSAVDIFETILDDIGYSGDFRKKLTSSYPQREYVIQYRESDFDFASRLLEEEGIHYFFAEDGGKDVLVLADGVSAYSPVEGDQTFKYFDISDENRRQMDHVYEWKKRAVATSGKVTLRDYNFENPRADLEVSSSKPKGRHRQNTYEQYDYPGHFREASDGERLARIRMEAEAVQHKTARAVANLSNVAVGRTFKLDNHPRKEENGEYVVTRAVHQFALTGGSNPPLGVEKPLGDDLKWDEIGQDPYRVVFEAIPKDEQYRHPLQTPWPKISGVHTAIVVGPSGNEIYTDEHGRIKIQFHWDRKGKRDDKSSCWVRCMMPWTGKNWGMVQIPRIGQEVVVDFEEGDPDRPIVIGMLYNADTMPPYKLPGNMTQSGILTRASKQGSTETAHELVFEDKKDEEFIRFQSERDYRQIIKNDAEVTIGLEKQDKGDLTQTIHRHKTETLKTGDMTFSVDAGSETRTIAKDKTETIGKELATKVGSSKSLNVGTNLSEKIGGSHSETVGTTLTISAGVKIELKVGGSSITIDPAGVTIKGPMVTVDGQLTQVKGSALLILKGGFTMIN